MTEPNDTVELHGGIVSAPVITWGQRITADCSAIGEYRFYVDVVENDQTHFPLWDGHSYEQAVQEAECTRKEWGAAKVIDCVKGTP